jgi:hypothetical protein
LESIILNHYTHRRAEGGNPLSNEEQAENETGQETEEQPEQEKSGVGEDPVGPIGIIVKIAYMTSVALFLS